MGVCRTCGQENELFCSCGGSVNELECEITRHYDQMVKEE